MNVEKRTIRTCDVLLREFHVKEVPALDPNSGQYTDMKVIAVRASFAPGPAKRTDLEDVVFSGGILRLADGTAALYAGISDAEAHYIVIPDPYLAYE